MKTKLEWLKTFANATTVAVSMCGAQILVSK
jgi:hypothetical protein